MMTTTPNPTSTTCIFVFFAKGSNSAAHNEHVAKPTRLVDGLDIRPEAKNVIQWKATIKPVSRSLIKSEVDTLKEPRIRMITAPIPMAARSVR